MGSALRTFQPTIKEVVQVSQELKGTLEKVRRTPQPQPQPHSGVIRRPHPSAGTWGCGRGACIRVCEMWVRSVGLHTHDH